MFVTWKFFVLQVVDFLMEFNYLMKRIVEKILWILIDFEEILKRNWDLILGNKFLENFVGFKF